jgi:subtilisin family serine protease
VHEKPDVTAFDGVSTSVPHFEHFFGTSAAAPHSAAVAALMLAKNPTLAPADVQGTLKATAVDVDAPGFDHRAGAGRIDAHAAVDAVPCVADGSVPRTVSCPGERVPSTVAARYRAAARRLGRIAAANPRRASRLVAAVERALGRAASSLGTATQRGRVSAGCSAAVGQAIELAASRALCVTRGS